MSPGHNRQQAGRIAGGNVAGGHDTFKEYWVLWSQKVFELFIAATGLSTTGSRRGYDAISVSITKADRAPTIRGPRQSHLPDR